MKLMDLVFPKECLGCNEVGAYLCSKCISQVKILPQVCPYCEKASIDGFTHARCRKKYGLDGLTAIWKYNGLIKKAILSFKFKFSTEIGRELVVHVTDLVNRNMVVLPKASFITAVPMFWYNQNVRGFNQAEYVGRELGKALGIYYVALLQKIRPTTSQIELTSVKRKTNLRGVFEISPGIVMQKYTSVILVDDVFTTGSTLFEACKVLKRKGVQKVWGLTLAR